MSYWDLILHRLHVVGLFGLVFMCFLIIGTWITTGRAPEDMDPFFSGLIFFLCLWVGCP